MKESDSCLNRVADARNLIYSQNYDNLSISPRKSLETSVIIVTSAISMIARNCWELSGQPILCFFPREGRWCKVGEMPREYSG